MNQRSYENRRLSMVLAVFTSTSVPISVISENRKRTASSSTTIQLPTKRQNIVTKKSKVAHRKQAASSSCAFFATPVYSI